MRNKQRLPLLACRVRLGAAFDRASAEWTSARLLQLLLTQFPEEVDNLLAVEEALFASPGNRARFPIAAGETVITLKSLDARRLSERLQDASVEAIRRSRPTALQPAITPASVNSTRGSPASAPATADLEILEILPAFTPGRTASCSVSHGGTWDALGTADEAA